MGASGHTVIRAVVIARLLDCSFASDIGPTPIRYGGLISPLSRLIAAFRKFMVGSRPVSN